MNHIIEVAFYDQADRLLQESTTWDHLTVRMDVPAWTTYIQVGPAIPPPAATDWREMFGRYLEIVGDAEGYTFIKETDWSAEELAKIRKLEAEARTVRALETERHQ